MIKGSHEKIIPTLHSTLELKAISYCISTGVIIHLVSVLGRLSNVKVLHARKKIYSARLVCPISWLGTLSPTSAAGCYRKATEDMKLLNWNALFIGHSN